MKFTKKNRRPRRNWRRVRALIGAQIDNSVSETIEWTKSYALPLIALIALAVGIATGYVVGYADGIDTLNKTVAHATHQPTYGGPLPTPVCGAPTPDDPGTAISEPPSDDETIRPTVPCATPHKYEPNTDVVVLISAEKAKQLPAELAGLQACIGFETDTAVRSETETIGPDCIDAACDLDSTFVTTKDVEKLFNDSDRKFLAAHALPASTNWSVQIRDTAELEHEYSAPQASFDPDADTFTVVIW